MSIPEIAPLEPFFILSGEAELYNPMFSYYIKGYIL